LQIMYNMYDYVLLPVLIMVIHYRY